MVDKAKKKLNDEMNKSKNPYIVTVGQFLLNHISNHSDDAEKIMQKDKSIAGSLEAMRKAAEKKKVGNMAVLTDQEGFDIVLSYFGIKGNAKVPQGAVVPTAEPTDLVFNVTLGG